MKVLIFLALFISSSFSLANTNNCQFNLPGGRTEIQILRSGQFVEHNPQQTHSVFSCGPFVNDGSVVVTPITQVIELAPNTCALSAYPGLNYVIFCN